MNMGKKGTRQSAGANCTQDQACRCQPAQWNVAGLSSIQNASSSVTASDRLAKRYIARRRQADLGSYSTTIPRWEEWTRTRQKSKHANAFRGREPTTRRTFDNKH